MTMKISIMVNFRYIALFLFLCIAKNASAQCWKNEEIPEGFKRNIVYTLDSLVVSERFYEVLDHAVALRDSFLIDKKDTWLYYMICLNSSVDSIGRNSITIKLLQGINDNLLYEILPFEGDKFYGAFCYKGFTFFIVCKNDNLPLFNELFYTKNKAEFHSYYNSPVADQGWIDVGMPYIIRYMYLFYYNKNGCFYYRSTVDGGLAP